MSTGIDCCLAKRLLSSELDQRLHQGGGDRLASPSPCSVVGDQASIPSEVAFESVHRPRQRLGNSPYAGMVAFSCWVLGEGMTNRGRSGRERLGIYGLVLE